MERCQVTRFWIADFGILINCKFHRLILKIRFQVSGVRKKLRIAVKD
jgi:hypothetical protein